MNREELIQQIFKEFDIRTNAVNERYANAKWDYANASFYSNSIGAKTSSVLEEYIPKALDEEIITLEDSKAIIGSIMKKSSDLCNEAALKAQELLNEEQKIGLKARKASVEEVNSRILNLTRKYASYEDHADGDWLLKRPVQENFAKSVIVDTMKLNGKIQYRAGIKAYIKRQGSGCCDYCQSLVGQYEMGKAPDEIWSFHKGCNCSIEYVTPYRSERITFETDKSGRTTKVTEEIDV